jgi:predicted dehydrogenase
MRVGVAGLIHGHVWGLIDRFAELPGAEMAAVADATPLLEQAAPRFKATYHRWQDMLERERLDALVVTSDNVESSNIAVEALNRGIPCLVEKAMAANGADAERMLEASRRSGKTLIINWPIYWAAWPHELQRQLADPTLGPAFHFRYRTGHHGPKEIGCDEHFVGWLYDEKRSGGGAVADFCCYGAALARWYFGMPERVFCAKGNYTKDYEVADDHAVCLLQYPKMSAILEGTWATFGFDDSANPVVHAKNGTIGVFGNRVARYEPGRETRQIEAPAPPVISPAAYFVGCVNSRHQPEGILDPVIACDAAHILDAAIKSSKTGQAERPKS